METKQLPRLQQQIINLLKAYNKSYLHPCNDHRTGRFYWSLKWGEVVVYKPKESDVDALIKAGILVRVTYGLILSRVERNTELST